jgi:hypothetical protein
MELATGTEVFALTSEFTPDTIQLAALIAGTESAADGGVGDDLAAAVRAAARRGSVRPRITIDVLLDAGKRLDPEDIPILGMLVHGTSAHDIASVLGLSGAELTHRRQRMLHALLER